MTNLFCSVARLRCMVASFAVATAAILTSLASPAALAQSSPSAYTTGYRYDSGSRLVGTIQPDPDGAGPIKFGAVRNSYNAQGMLIKVETGELAAWQSESVAPASWSGFSVFQVKDTTYDNFGRKLTDKVSANGTPYGLTQYSYDSMGRLACTAVRMNPAAYTSLPADACTLGAEGADGPDRITKNTYDATTHVLKIQKALGTSLQQDYANYTYSPNGKQTSATDANGNYSFYVYDGFDRQSYWYFPSKTTAGQYNTGDYEQYSYDNNGNRLTLRKRDGNTIYYAYDGLNRVTSTSFPGMLATIVNKYDLRGLQLYARVNAESGFGITNTYDGFGQVLTSCTDQAGGSCPGNTGRKLSYAYDSEGNRQRVTHPDGQYFDYRYDGLNRLTFILDSAASRVATVTYDNQGRRQFLTRGGDLGAGVSSTSYGYDPVSRLQMLTQDLAGTAYDEIRAFGYNPASQVTTRALNNTVYTFAQAPTVTTNYIVNGLNQYTQLTSSATVSPLHDANGNMTNDGARTYYYDVLNRMTGAVVNATGAKVVDLVYDPKGRLFQTSGGASGTTQYLYDGDALVGEYSASGTLLRRYVHGSAVDSPLVWYEGTSTSAASRRFYHVDHQGSVMAATDSAGNAIQVNTYDTYGLPASGNTSGAYQTRFQYTGQIMLPDLGQYYYKARIYNPTLGRFMQTDPIGYKDDLDLYTYVGDDPLNKTDPSGNIAVADDIIVGGGVLVIGCAMSPGCREAIGGAIKSASDAIAAGVSRLLKGSDEAAEGKGSTLQPGKNAGDSIPARGPGRDFTPEEREKINDIGQKDGCHTCGTTDPGTKSGNFIPDHQPPNSQNPDGGPQRLYPHCINCSRVQGGQSRQAPKQAPKPPKPKEQGSATKLD